MKLGSFDKIKEDLEQEKQNNEKKIILYDEKARISKVNTFEYKAGNTLAFSMISHLVIFLISLVLIKNLGIITFTNIIPALSYPAIVVGGSLGIGTLINNLINKKFQTKKRLKVFSTAKTQTEKLKEQLHYQIELEKAINRNLVINQTINQVNSTEAMLREISSKYEINDKSASKKEEDIRKRIEELSILVKEQYNKLDILSTQKVLHNRFWRIRSKIQIITDTFVTATLIGMFTMFFTELPLMVINEAVTYSSTLSFITTTFTPFIVGIIGACGYMIKRNKDHKKIFDNFNAQLGENALPEKYEKYDSVYKEQEKIKTLTEKQIRNISLTVIQLKEEQQIFNSMDSKKDSEMHLESKNKSKEQKDISFKDFSQLFTIEKNFNDPLPYEEKEAVLVRKRTYTNPNDKE